MDLKCYNKIKVLGQWFDLNWIDREHSDDSYNLGTTHTGTLDIQIATQRKPSHLANTILHEVLHSICSAMSIRRKDGEEAIVTKMANGLQAVISDNPWLMPMIQELCESSGSKHNASSNGSKSSRKKGVKPHSAKS